MQFKFSGVGVVFYKGRKIAEGSPYTQNFITTDRDVAKVLVDRGYNMIEGSFEEPVVPKPVETLATDTVETSVSEEAVTTPNRRRK